MSGCAAHKGVGEIIYFTFTILFFLSFFSESGILKTFHFRYENQASEFPRYLKGEMSL